MRRRAAGEGSIRQRADGRWEGKLTVGRNPTTGKQLRRSVYGDTQREVVAKLQELQEQLRGGQVPTSAATVGQAADLWFLTKEGSLSLRSQARYRADLDHLKAALGAAQLRALDGPRIAAWYRAMAEAGESSAARQRRGRRLRQVLEWHTRQGHLVRNPSLAVPLPRHDPEEIRPLTEQQAKDLIAATVGKRWMGAIVAVALDSGAREAELLALHREHWDRPVVRIRQQTTRQGIEATKTPKSRRDVILSGPTADALDYHLTTHGYDIIFPAVRGGYWGQPNFHREWWSPLREAVGFPSLRFHDLRHTMATLLLSAGVDIVTVSRRLGHSSATQTLRTYAHVLPSMAERAATVIGGLIW